LDAVNFEDMAVFYGHIPKYQIDVIFRVVGEFGTVVVRLCPVETLGPIRDIGPIPVFEQRDGLDTSVKLSASRT